MYEHEIAIMEIHQKLLKSFPHFVGWSKCKLWMQAKKNGSVTYTEYNAARKYYIEKGEWE